MKLAQKLSVLLVAAVLLVVGGAGSLWVFREARRGEAGTHDALIAIGRAIRPALIHTWQTQGRDQAMELLDYVDERYIKLRDISIRWVSLEAPRGGVDAPLVDARRLAPLDERRPVTITARREGWLRAYVPVVAPGIPRGALELSESLDASRAFVNRGIRTVGLSALFIALVLVGTILFVVHALLGRPLRMLARQARSVADGDLSARVELDPESDLGRFAREMNLMCERLLESRQRVASEHAARLDAVERLRHADRLATVGQLAAGIAHELGTPLAVIGGRAKMIELGEAQGDEVQESARVIVAQSERVATIIRQLLGFARRQPGVKVLGSVAAVVRQTLALLGPIAKKRGVTLEVAEPLGDEAAWVDVRQLEQALTNLVINGIQAMPDGGRLIVGMAHEHVQPPPSANQLEGDYLRVDVQDQGSGVAEEHVAHLFDPFFTTKPVGEGTGLGLSVAYSIARDHAGWIDLVSTPGRGSCFALHLPVASS